tara:strand:+ start:79 stop:300 length:222 start_codon:yes stop_codon:yes gene_type:complete
MEAKPSIINKFAIKEIPVTTHAKVEILLNGTSNIHHSKMIGAKVIPNGKPDKNPRNMAIIIKITIPLKKDSSK